VLFFKEKNRPLKETTFCISGCREAACRVDCVNRNLENSKKKSLKETTSCVPESLEAACRVDRVKEM